MGNFRTGVWLSTALTLGCGCSSPQRRVYYNEFELKGNRAGAYSTPADVRLSFIRSNTQPFSWCSEPMPDVALGSDASISGSLSAASALSKSQSTSASLARANEILAEENARLRRQLDEALREYERASKESSSTTASSARSSSSDLEASSKVDLQAAARLAITVSQLEGRSQEVLLAREFLYRLCEARANGFITSPDVYSAQQLNAIKMIAQIYESRSRVGAAEKIASSNVDMLKAVTEYNKHRESLCAATSTACLEAAGDDKGEKQKCASAKKTCLSFVPAPAPQMETPPKLDKPLQNQLDLAAPSLGQQEADPEPPPAPAPTPPVLAVPPQK